MFHSQAAEGVTGLTETIRVSLEFCPQPEDWVPHSLLPPLPSCLVPGAVSHLVPHLSPQESFCHAGALPSPGPPHGLHVVCPCYPDTIFILLNASYAHGSILPLRLHLLSGLLICLLQEPFTLLTPLLGLWLLAFQTQTHLPAPLPSEQGYLRDPPSFPGSWDFCEGIFLSSVLSLPFGV